MAKPDVDDEEDFYEYLTMFGMYRPSQDALSLVEQLKKEAIWDKVEKLYKKYQKKWEGPTVDIYIFPINQSNRYFIQRLKGRSGLAFQDTLFLFVEAGLDASDLEALIVHEYHHAARMSHYNKKPELYHLLDSIIFEGLAELAVLNYCGKKYVASWANQYTIAELKNYMERLYKPNFDKTRANHLHDDLLFGRRGIPTMMGYALGYEIAKGFIKQNKITIHESFRIPSEEILINNDFFTVKNE